MRTSARVIFPLTAALALAAGLATAGEAKTPLGKWMKPNMGAPLAGQDFEALQKSFDFVATKPPSPSYPQWAAIAKAGAAVPVIATVPGRGPRSRRPAQAARGRGLPMW